MLPPSSGFIVLLSISCLLSGHTPTATKDEWVFKKEKDKIRVYTKKMPDGITAIKLTASVQSTLSGVVQLFYDVEDYESWGYKMAEARLIKRYSPFEHHYYARFDFPWPLADRDIVLHSKMVQDADTKTIHIDNNAVNGFVEEQKGVVRIRQARTQWYFFAPKNGWLYLEQYVVSDPGGDVPDWATDFAIDSGPVETIKGVRNRLKTERYQHAKVSHILE